MTRAPYDDEPLTKRERMAAMMMQGMLSNYAHVSVFQEEQATLEARGVRSVDASAGLFALQAVIYADALLARLARQPSPPAPTPDVEGLCDE
jgi:hypothetical protein